MSEFSPSPLRLALLGLAVLLVGLVVRVPAGQVVHRLPLPQGTAVSGVEGTLFEGRAAAARIGGIYLQDIRWELHPSRLLLARLTVRVSTDGRTRLEGLVSLGPGGYRIAGLRGTVPVDDLGIVQTQLPLPAPLEGRLEFEGVSAEGDAGYPTGASGVISARSLHLAAPLDFALGDYRAELETATDGAGIAARIEDEQGPLDLQGRASLSPSGDWRMEASLGARPGAPPGVEQALDYVGPAGPDGRRRMELSGRLPPP